MKEKAQIIANAVETLEFTIYDIIAIAKEFGFEDEGNVQRALEAAKQVIKKARRTVQQKANE